MVVRAKEYNRPAKPSKTVTVKAYYSWLCDIINVNQPDYSYWLLAKALHNKIFYWSVPNDDNRAFEARNLRERFCEETGHPYVMEYFSDDVSMLELIVALAFRCNDIMTDQDDNMPIDKWFWKILSNVGLDKFTDDAYRTLHGHFVVDEILDTIINRTYRRNGQGGLFPMKFNKKDQRRVELWYQMSEYLVENYYAKDMGF